MDDYFRDSYQTEQSDVQDQALIQQRYNKISFDEALERVGSCHRYQKRAFIFFGLQWLFASWILLAPVYIFIAPEVLCHDDNDCKQKCPDVDSFLKQKECQTYICNFPTTQERLKYLTNKSLITAFDDPLICQNEDKKDFLEQILYIGSLIGFFIFSFVADNYGRRKGLFLAWFCATIGAILLACSVNFYMVGIALFLLGFGINPAITIQYSLFNEHTCIFNDIKTNKKNHIQVGKFRDLQNIGVQIFFGIGEILIVVIAFYFSAWRILAIFWYSLPLLIMNFGIFLIFESPKYLYQKKIEESIQVLNKIANVNKRDTIRPNQLSHSNNNHDQDKPRVFSILDLFRYRSLNIIFICSFLVFFSVQSVYYGINFVLQTIGFNFYVTALIVGICETISFAISDHFIVRLPRKKSVIYGLLISSILAFLFLLLKPPQSCGQICLEKIIQIALIGLLRFIVCGVQAIMYTYISELFPTVVRSLAVGLISAGGTIGSILAPSILRLSNFIGISNPLILFGMISIIGSLFVIPLRETLDTQLQDEIQEDLTLQKLQQYNTTTDNKDDSTIENFIRSNQVSDLNENQDLIKPSSKQTSSFRDESNENQ